LDEQMTDTALEVREGTQLLRFTFTDLLNYNGGGSAAGVAHAFQAMARALPGLDPEGPPQRREIGVRTAFRGPGGRDSFELVTRAVTDERFVIDLSLGRPERGPAFAHFVFRFTYRDVAVTAVLRDGFVPDEFLDLAGRETRTDAEEARLTALKTEVSDRLRAAPAADVYDLETTP
jgi:hypothetical protein